MVTIADIDHVESPSSPSQNLCGISKTMFVAMAELSVLLADILSTFYTVRGIHTLSEVSLQEGGIIDSFTNRLAEWAKLYDNLLRGKQKVLPDPTGIFSCSPFLQVGLSSNVMRTKGPCNWHITQLKSHFVVLSFESEIVIAYEGVARISL